MTTVPKYGVFEASFPESALGGAPDGGDALSAVFVHEEGGESSTVFGFRDGDGICRLRFMPRREGRYSAVVHSPDPAIDGTALEFLCAAARPGVHGRVLPMDEARGRPDASSEEHQRFAYEDGTRFQPLGTTCYAWIHQTEEVQEQTVATLGKSPFNKVRMCVFPKFYEYCGEDPDCYPFAGDAERGFDFGHFNPVFWRKLERRIAQLGELGIEADIILFHPYDRWGFSKMEPAVDDRYLRYAVDRLAAFRNVWWSLANEYDLMGAKSMADWDRFGRILQRRDPYGHLRSVHNCCGHFDFSLPWVTHACIQRTDMYRTTENVGEWRARYRKPVIVDECAYEGDIEHGWGNISGEELVRRFWEAFLRGGYASHGEVYVKNPRLWWAHGGRLYGTAPARLALLRHVMEETPENAVPLSNDAGDQGACWDVPCLGDKAEASFFLYYFGFLRPSYRHFSLPEKRAYEAEIIDTWNQSVERLPGLFRGRFRIELPARPFVAVRFRAVLK